MIYAVLLAFAVIVVWQKFSDAETAVVQEAGAAATLYRLASGPEPDAVATRAALTNYLRLAIDRDWPRMAAGEDSREVMQALDALYADALRLTEKGSRQPAIFGEIFKQLDAITQARRIRLQVARGIVPGILWLVLFCGAVLTVGFTIFSAPRICRLRSDGAFGSTCLECTAMLTLYAYPDLFGVADNNPYGLKVYAFLKL